MKLPNNERDSLNWISLITKLIFQYGEQITSNRVLGQRDPMGTLNNIGYYVGYWQTSLKGGCHTQVVGQYKMNSMAKIFGGSLFHNAVLGHLFVCFVLKVLCVYIIASGFIFLRDFKGFLYMYVSLYPYVFLSLFC